MAHPNGKGGWALTDEDIAEIMDVSFGNDIDPPSITCPQCGRTSYHPKDVSERYCGNCREYHDTMKE